MSDQFDDSDSFKQNPFIEGKDIFHQFLYYDKNNTMKLNIKQNYLAKDNRSEQISIALSDKERELEGMYFGLLFRYAKSIFIENWWKSEEGSSIARTQYNNNESSKEIKRENSRKSWA